MDSEKPVILHSLDPWRPSPLPALTALPKPTLITNPRKRIRKTGDVVYDDKQPIPEPWEPLGEPEREFQYKAVKDPEESMMGSHLASNQRPWIRLLKIRPLIPMKGGEHQQYEFITVRSHDYPQYKAIPYAWGDPVNAEVIWVTQDNRQGWLKIPMNLSHALRALQDNTEDIFVWADSICINQKDNRDKTQQLSRIPDIYGQAEQVVLWLGVEKEDSARAHKILHGLTHAELQLNHDTDLSSVVSLFDRGYWSRLWVVQEILHAKDIVVQCGSSWLSWNDYTSASELFHSERNTLANIPSLVPGSYDSTRPITSQHRLSPLQILVHHGPASISHIQKARELYLDDDYSYFLHLLRISRTKLASDSRDRVYGILGILPEKIRSALRLNYLLPVREIYIDVVDILHRAYKMDVICESIHFPPQISNANLPSWVPDWSYDPMVRSLASLPLSFSAGHWKDFKFVSQGNRISPRTRSRLSIRGVRIGTINSHGMAVNTHSRAVDYCMAFLQWRALLLQHFEIRFASSSADGDEETRRYRVVSCEQQRRFCLTLSLGQPIRTYSSDANLVSKGSEKDLGIDWARKCYSVFAKIIRARLPVLPIDEDLMAFAEMDDDMEPKAARQFLQDSFAENMMGRCFCILDSKCMGLGSGAMARGDVVVVPYGCSTPVLLRPERYGAEDGDGKLSYGYRFVGDAYIHGYMDGEAMELGPSEDFMLH